MERSVILLKTLKMVILYDMQQILTLNDLHLHLYISTLDAINRNA